MKTLFHTLLSTVVLMLASCSSEMEELTPAAEDGGILHTAVLRFEGDILQFDSKTRVATSEWDDGAQLFIQYQTGNGRVKGVATYNESSDEWTVNYFGSITRNETAACEVYYFGNPKSVTNDAVELDETSAIFLDKGATYLFKDGVVHLKTHLLPQTGRIRFHGTPGYEFTLSGVKHYTKYSLIDNTLITNNNVLSLIIGNNGYSPYVYALFIDETDRELTICNKDDDRLYYTTFDRAVLFEGKSGYLNVPTKDEHNGWNDAEDFKVCPDIHHPHMIDMGTGLKFACCNVGASSPIEYGDYFAWGETKTKTTNYDWSTYTLCNGSNSSLIKYNYSSYDGPVVDNKDQLELSDDAAHVNWGGTWRMPTTKELKWLITCCTWTWTTIKNVSGYYVTASNGNTLFLPAAGYFTSDRNITIDDRGKYWSSNLYAGSISVAYKASILSFHSKYKGEIDEKRCYGLSVRPVTE